MSITSFHITNWNKFKHIIQENNNTYFLLYLSKEKIVFLASLWYLFIWQFFLASAGSSLLCLPVCDKGDAPLHRSHRIFQFSSVAQSCLTLLTPWTAACQASLSINSQNLLKLMSVELVMPSNHLILCHPLLLLPSIFLSIRVFSSDSVYRIRWPKYWSFSFNISPSNEYSGLISFRMD